MEMQYFKEYSAGAGPGDGVQSLRARGTAHAVHPLSGRRFFDFEDFHMADTLAPWIESGQLMVMSIDTLDKETWSDTNGDPYWRIRRYERSPALYRGRSCPQAALSVQGAQWLG